MLWRNGVGRDVVPGEQMEYIGFRWTAEIKSSQKGKAYQLVEVVMMMLGGVGSLYVETAHGAAEHDRHKDGGERGWLAMAACELRSSQWHSCM